MKALKNLLNPKTRFLTLFAAATTLVLAGCGGQGGWQMPPPVVETSLAVQRPWTINYSTTGTLEANNKVDLNVETPGTVSRIAVSEGDYVKRGQLLIRLKADKQLAQVQQSRAGITASLSGLEQYKADISQAEARLVSALTRKKLAQSELERFNKLYKEQFISQLELEQKRTSFETADQAYVEAMEALSSARARLAQAKSSLEQARSSYQYNVALAGDTVIRAPFSGVVGQKYVDLGDYVAPTEKLITLVDPSQYKIEFAVPERYLSQLDMGQAVRVRFEGLGEQAFPGRVNFIDPVVDADAHTITAKAIVPAASSLKHGLFGRVALALGTIPNAVVVPEEAIVPQGEKTFVYIVRREVPKDASGKPAQKETAHVAHLQEVVIGHREAGQVQIESGLRAGDRVIVGGLQKVNDGLTVQLKSEMKPAKTEAEKGH